MMIRIVAAFVLLSLSGEGILRAQHLPPPPVVSYNSSTQYGRNNRDSVLRALRRLGIPYDTLDRDTRGATPIDYTNWGLVIWASGDPTVPVVPEEPTGQAGLSLKETQELKTFLQAGRTNAKRALIMAGQNIAYQNGYLMPNGSSDTEFLHTWLHVAFVANSPSAGAYNEWIDGYQPAYWNSRDSLSCPSPDVVSPSIVTPQVGPVVNKPAYHYGRHPLTPTDSGAGVTYYDPTINTVFFAFDWADAFQALEAGPLTAGVTRILKGAGQFAESHGSLGGPASVAVTHVPVVTNICFPNLITGQSTFHFKLDQSVVVSLKLFDVTGREVAVLASGFFDAGEHEVTFDRGTLPGGVYFCRLEAGGQSAARAVVILP